MEEFTIYGGATIGVFAKATAPTREEAIEIVESYGMPGLCHQCVSAGGDGDSWGLSDGVEAIVDVEGDETDREATGRAIDAAVAAERARCLAIVERLGVASSGSAANWDHGYGSACREIRAAIEAREGEGGDDE